MKELKYIPILCMLILLSSSVLGIIGSIDRPRIIFYTGIDEPTQPKELNVRNKDNFTVNVTLEVENPDIVTISISEATIPPGEQLPVLITPNYELKEGHHESRIYIKYTGNGERVGVSTVVTVISERKDYVMTIIIVCGVIVVLAGFIGVLTYFRKRKKIDMDKWLSMQELGKEETEKKQ